MKHVIRKIAIQFMHKHIEENEINFQKIALHSGDISYFNLSSNSIMSFTYKSKQFYFRKCPEIFEEKIYFANAIKQFFDTLGNLGINKQHFAQEIPININYSDDCITTFYNYINKISNEKIFQRKIKKADMISEKIGFSIWEKRIYDKRFFESFGLIDIPDSLFEISIYFLWYMRSVSANYRYLMVVHGNKYSFFSSVKSVATRIVAEELNLQQMITNVSWCLLEIEGKKSIFGLLSEAAPGYRMCDIKVPATGSLQRELMNLNVLDTICFQRDHGPNNYNILVDGMDNNSVCAFDNDHPFTFFPISSLTIAMSGCAPLTDKKGIIIRPYFDKNTEEAINQLNIKKLKKRLKPYLNFLQIQALICRLKKLEKSINKTKILKRNFLLQNSDWNDQTVAEELSGRYGTTYLMKAMCIK